MSVLLSGLIAFCVGLDEPKWFDVSALCQPTCSVVVVSDGAVSCCVKTLNAAAPVITNDGVVRLAAWTPDDDDESPWIGVRMSPVPAPLAAHIGDSGLMVANVVKGSPADKAGIERYDVIVSFNGRTIDETSELVEAISDVGARQRARVVLLRGGEKKRLVIRPTDRKNADEIEWKYDEPSSVGNITQFRGHALKLDDDGNWVLEDLGQLKQLPNFLKDMRLFGGPDGLKFDFDFDFDGLKLDPDAFKLKWDAGDLRGLVLPHLGGRFNLFSDIDGDGRIEIKIKTSDDAGSITVHRDSDGKIHVTRADEDGEETSETYDDMDELRENDPDAADLFGKHSWVGQRRLMRIRPNIRLLPGKQLRFQTLIEKSLKDAIKDGNLHMLQLQPRMLLRNDLFDMDLDSQSEAVAIMMSGDGIKITVRHDGETKTYEFDSWDDFKEGEPELFKKLKIHRFGDDEEPS